MDLLQQQQQRREEQILSLFGSIEDRELLRSAAEDPGGPDQSASSWELADSRPLDTAPAGPAVAPAPVPTTAAVPGLAPYMTAAQSIQPSEAVIVKRKRGRPPKNATALNGTSNALVPSQLRKQVEEEEDVCFICFDGGTLVLCDQKGCPKAYHATCVKREPSFFQSRAKWMCGWHICSTCGKGAYYMCYTCTYSLCKNCTKDADYVSVRGNKGLCGTCMKTIMLIEKIPQGNQEMVQVDFDDKTSWEYLFKVYWVCLKEKLSLTINELTEAKSPWVESTSAIPTGEPSVISSYSNGDRRYSSGSSNGYQSARPRRGRKPKEQPKLFDSEAQSEQVHLGEQPSSQNANWASKELLEFVGHMKDGDVSVLSQFDVQALLLEYIRKNNLRDPQRKCQIVCDARLLNLFGRTILGHFEMLKLLDSHFLVKENPKIDACIRGSIVDPGASQVNNGLNTDNQSPLDNKRRKTRKQVDEKVPQVNPNDYAAVDAHNVSLIYLRRNMMEKLLDDHENFQDKIVGSIVRIKVSGGNQNQDMYRLVPVIGTRSVAETYMVGNKTAGVVLEIANLDKKEVMKIDDISNQEISEDELGHLRQSIKCGQIKWLTVGDLRQKALRLQESRVNEWMEAELLRLNNLRDRASEAGHQKEHREWVENIQLLNSPEERQRRLHEIPEVHADQSLHSNHVTQGIPSAPDQKKQDVVKPSSGRGRKRKQAVSSESGNTILNNRRNLPRRNQPLASDPERESSGLTHEVNKNKMSRSDPAVSVVCALGSPNGRQDSASAVASEISRSPLSNGTDQSVSNDAENYKIWHYRDPTGKTQGPFTMAQLRKWNGSGHFPPDLGIWRVDGRQEDSILLTEALSGNYNKQEPGTLSDNKNINLNSSGNASPTPAQMEMNIAEVSPNLKEECRSSPPKPKSEDTNEVAEGLASSEGRIITVAEVWNSLNDDDGISLVQPQPQPCSSVQLPSNHGQTSVPGNEHQESSHDSENLMLFGLPKFVPTVNNKERQSDGDERSGQLSGQNWNNAAHSSMEKSLETSEQNEGIEFPDAPSAVRPQSERIAGNGEQDKQNLPNKNLPSTWSNSPSLVPEATQAKGVTERWGDEWDSTLGSDTSLTLRPIDMPGDDNSAAQTITVHSSQTHHQLSLESSWQAIVNETNDFASLGEESVSDLLAEVEAMEKAGLPSPTSALKCSHDLNDDGKDDCFSPIEGFDPTPPPGPVKTEVFTPAVDLIVTTQTTTTTNETPPSVSLNGDVGDSRRTSHKHSSSTEHDRDRKQQIENNTGRRSRSGMSSELPRITPPQPTWQTPGTSPHAWGAVQGSSHWDGSSHGHSNTDWEAPRQGQYLRTGSFGSSSPSTWSSQQRYSSGGGGGSSSSRYSSPRDQGGYGRSGRGPWSGGGGGSRPYSGGGSGSGYRQQTPKGQRVCKFYESGYCKRGASCSYFHP